jgi:sulfur-oxidizing protein SoxZ
MAAKIRATLSGDVAEIKVVMDHPMETGQRKDPRTGQLLPAHFIQTVTATLAGRTVLSAQWGPAVSKNPFFALRVKGAKAGDPVVVSWDDNKGEHGRAETKVQG